MRRGRVGQRRARAVVAVGAGMARTRASTRSGARPFAALEPRAVLEMCVSALTTALAVASLRAGGRARESWALAALGVAALWGEGARWWRLLPEAREGVQGGVHLGVLALPWTFAARDDPGALWPCVVAGFAAIAASTAPTTRGAAFARPALAAAALAASVAAAAGLLPPDRDRASTLALAAALALHARLAVALAAWIPPAVPGALTRAEAILAANGFTLAVALAAARTARELHLAPAWLPPSLDNASALPDALERARAMIVACVVLACALLVAARAFVRGVTPTPTPTPTPRAASRGLTASARASPPARPRGARPRGAPLAAAAVMLALAAAFAHAWGLAPFPNPVAWTARRVLASGASARRLAAFWAVVLGGGLSAVNRVARLPGAPRTLFLRKLYHALAVAAFAPPALPAAATAALGLGLPEPEILALAYAHALALFAAAEVARLADPEVRVPTLGRGGGGGDDDDGCPKRAWRVVRVGAALDARARRFADHRDPGLAGGARRTVLFSHFSLLVGVALPLWLTPEAWAGGAGGEAGEGGVAATLAPFAGVVALGVGDAAAAAAGASGFGGRRTPLCRGWRKTVEGFVAGAVANALASAALWRLAHAGRAEVGGSPGIPAVPAVPWVPVAAASAGAAALEATTEQNDNAFLPLHYFAALSLAARVTGA